MFFATAPLSVVIPVVLFAPWRNNFVDDRQLFSKQLVLSIIATLLMVFVFAKSSYINNTVWIEAGKQTRAVTTQIQKMAHSTPKGKSFAVLGVPKENAGSHMILNGPTLSFLLEPPFTNQSMSKRLVSFEPILYGKDDLLNVEHFRWALKNKDISNFYVWQFDKRAFAELPLKQELPINTNNLDIQIPKLDSSSNSTAKTSSPFIMPHPTKMPYKTSIDPKTDAINFKEARTGLGMEIAPLNIQPLQYDYLEIDIAKNEFESLIGKKITLSWSGQTKLQIRDRKEHSVAIDFQSRQSWQSENIRSIRIPLSSFWAWSTFKSINGINIKFPPTESLTIFNARLVPISELAPSIQVVNQAPQGYGTYSLASADKLSLVVSPIADTHHIELEIAKNNFFFENFSGDQIKNSIWKTIKIDNQSRTAEVMRSDFQGSGYNQMRAKCVTESGDTIGEVSYPITVEIPD